MKKLHCGLFYPGKQSEQDICENTTPAELEKVNTNVKGMGTNSWSNMLICGDNLRALKTLWLMKHDGKLTTDQDKSGVTLVYIDPPFSTSQKYRASAGRTATVSSSLEDEAAYDDILVGPEYLEFVRHRLVLLKRLLSEDGSIYVHIDWKMGHHMKVLMDEIFGPEHFINDIGRIKCNPKNFQRRAYGNIKDMVLFYSKGDQYIWNESKEAMSEDDIRRLFPKIDKDGQRYTTTPLHAPGETKSGPTGGKWKGLKPPRGRHWRYDPAELTRLDEEGLIEWSSTGNPRKKIYAYQAMKDGKKRQDVWEFKDPAYPSYPTEKNLEMLETIVQASSNPRDIVLDCFAGSGTTLIAAEIHGRRWIGIDDSPLAIETTQRRLLAVGTVSPFTVWRVREK